MKKAIWIVLWCALFAIALRSTQADEVQKSLEPRLNSAPAGEYKPLTWWASFTLGSSYYTNPLRAQSISVAYAYEGPEFSDEFKNAALWSLARQGRISFGLVDQETNSMTVVPSPVLIRNYNISGPVDFAQVLARQDVKIIASDNVLLGETSKAAVVKTDLSTKVK